MAYILKEAAADRKPKPLTKQMEGEATERLRSRIARRK